MKRIFIPVLLLVLTVACKSNSSNSSKDSLNKISKSSSKPSEAEILALIKKFKPNIQGVWVKADYISEIAKTNSPLKAFTKAGNITTLIIKPELIRGDSLLIDVGYGNHEGGNLIIKFKKGHLANAILAYNPGNNINDGFYELNYAVKKDTTLTLFTFDKDKKPVDSTRYVRVFNNRSSKELGEGTDYIVNKTLISGNYILTDSLNRTERISFTNDGNVSGFSDFKTFYIAIDFTTPPNNLDEIIFVLNSKKQKSFGYTITADTLKLFETTYTKDSLQLVLGRLKYKLVRQK